MISRITATEASRNFSSVLDRVEHRRERFVVVRGGEDICTISPAGPTRRTVADLVAFLRDVPVPDPGYARIVRDAARKQERTSRRSPWGR